MAKCLDDNGVSRDDPELTGKLVKNSKTLNSVAKKAAKDANPVYNRNETASSGQDLTEELQEEEETDVDPDAPNFKELMMEVFNKMDKGLRT